MICATIGVVWSRPEQTQAGIITTYVTGAVGGGLDVIFRVSLDAEIAGSASVSIAVHETRGFGLDGIDFVPGSGGTKVVVGVPAGKITQYDVGTGATLPDLISDTTAIAVPPGSPTHPSTVLSTSTDLYYVENQFGFDGSAVHRIMQKPFAGGPEKVVFDGSAPGAGGLVEFEGLEIVDGRLYFFAQDPPPAPAATTRALMSIGLAGGVWDGLAPKIEIAGLKRGGVGGPGPGLSDGSDELDFDPFSGLLFGTNIINGELIAFNPFTGMEFIPGVAGSMSHFIDGGHPLTAPYMIDGIRSDGTGHLVYVGRGGIIGAIDIDSVLTFGAADSSSVYSLFTDPSYTFDDMTPLSVPEPSTFALLSMGVVFLIGFCRRRQNLATQKDTL